MSHRGTKAKRDDEARLFHAALGRSAARAGLPAISSDPAYQRAYRREMKKRESR